MAQTLATTMEDRPTQTTDAGIVLRFTLFTRVLHAGLAVSVYGLILTGMPLKYPNAFWAEPLMHLWGGPRWAGFSHRAFATLLIAVGVLHLGGAAVATVRKRLPRLLGPDSMVPLLGDVRNMAQYWRYLRARGSRPQFGRFTYWEKFDYFAVFWGLVVIGGSGVVMWFPETVTRFLPGWVVNVALIVHSDEALLATGFLFAVHFFNTHLRPEAFPLDTVIFSGSVPEEEVKDRWPGWYLRLPPSARRRCDAANGGVGCPPFARPVGVTLMGLGVIILIFVMFAAIQEVWSQLASLVH